MWLCFLLPIMVQAISGRCKTEIFKAEHYRQTKMSLLYAPALTSLLDDQTIEEENLIGSDLRVPTCAQESVPEPPVQASF